MKANIVKVILNIIRINITIILFFLVLIILNLIGTNSFLGYLAVYLFFPVTLILNLVLFYISSKRNEFSPLEKNLLNVVKICVISFMLFLILIKIELADPAIGYAYIYVLFPYTLIVLIIYTIILLKNRKFNLLKKTLGKLSIWGLILVLGIVLNNLEPV